MSEATVYFLIALNVLIILGLSAYIYRFYQNHKNKKTEAEKKLKALAEEMQQRRLHIIESLQVISQAVANGEAPLTEASIRCKVLLDNLDPQLGQSEAYIVFNEVYELSKHIPKLDGWKALKGPEKLKFMAEIEQIEADYGPRIKKASAALREQDFNHYH